MTTTLTKLRVQAGALLFEMEGPVSFVEKQLELHRDHIETILNEQARLIKSGKIPPAEGRRRGRPRGATAPGAGRRPGRQPVIIRESSLELKPRVLGALRKFLESAAGPGRLGKDATVFAVAFFLCTEVLGRDTFTAGDVMAAIRQVGDTGLIPDPDTIDVVQMLRNLAAASIGKEWVERNNDGTFALTAKGREAGASGRIVRPRGRQAAPRAAEPPPKTRRAAGRKAKPAGRRKK